MIWDRYAACEGTARSPYTMSGAEHGRSLAHIEAIADLGGIYLATLIGRFEKTEQAFSSTISSL